MLHVFETKKFVMAILHGKQGQLCDTKILCKNNTILSAITMYMQLD